MAGAHARALARPAGPVRVRDQAREALAVMAFSAAVSGVLALALLLLTTLGA